MKNCFFSGTYSMIKKIVISIVGFTILFIGILLIFLPGPAVVVIPIGLSILALEFNWPKRLLKKAKEKYQNFISKSRDKN